MFMTLEIDHLGGGGKGVRGINPLSTWMLSRKLTRLTNDDLPATQDDDEARHTLCKANALFRN